MTLQTFSSKKYRISACSSWLSPQRSSILSSLLAAAVLLLQVAGCALPYGLTAPEHAAIKAGNRAVVLVHIQSTIDDQPWDASNTSSGPSLFFSFGLGSFDTVGMPTFTSLRYLSDQSARAGWIFFLLIPGIHYLAILGPDSSYEEGRAPTFEELQKAPRWRIDVPEKVPCIYTGTLSFAGRIDGELMFGGKIIRPIKSDNVPLLLDESKSARQMIAEHLPDIDAPKTLLMQRWQPGDPIIIRTPNRSTNLPK